MNADIRRRYALDDLARPPATRACTAIYFAGALANPADILARARRARPGKFAPICRTRFSELASDKLCQGIVRLTGSGL